MKTYQCHKQVQAAKIVNMQLFSQTHADQGRAILHLEGGGFVTVALDWYKKHTPQCGGYYVQYADGDSSFSPAKAFEEGYTLLADMIKEAQKMGLDAEMVRIEAIARVCHEVNRAYCQALGDHSQPAWHDAPEWQRSSARIGVDLHLSGNFGPEASHISWMNQKIEEGWVYGPEKNPEKKEHHCMVPFNQLPREQQAKDYIFRAVVHALK